jgi:predicted nucleic-acid-binding Zn-ribbon protein
MLSSKYCFGGNSTLKLEVIHSSTMKINTNKTIHITTKNTTTTTFYTAGTSDVNVWFGLLYILYTVLTPLDKISFTLLGMTLKSNGHCF